MGAVKEQAVLASASESVRKWLEENRTGIVTLVTSKGIYLTLGGQVVLLCGGEWGITPIGVAMESWKTVAGLGLKAGDAASCREGRLEFPGAALQICWKERACLSPAVQPDAGSLARAEERLLTLEAKSGLAPVYAQLIYGAFGKETNIYCRVALPCMERLLAGLQKEDSRMVSDAVSGLLGLGTGLTPSGDDVLCGMLYVLVRSGIAESAGVQAMKNAVLALAEERTNAISAAYLTAIARGGNYERMGAVLAYLSGQGEDQIQKLLEVGSNSGSEMLLGMLAAVRLLAQKEGM